MKNAAVNIEIMVMSREEIEADNLVAKLVFVGTDELIVVPVELESAIAVVPKEVPVDEPFEVVEVKD